jgi:hypothetical protein
VAVAENAGNSISSAGDVNGDGFADLLIGASKANQNSSNSDSGFSYVVFGKASGFTARVDLSNLDGNNGFRLDGASGDLSGDSVSSAGNVNGFDDLLVGAPSAERNGDDYGSSYVVFGGNIHGAVTAWVQLEQINSRAARKPTGLWLVTATIC